MNDLTSFALVTLALLTAMSTLLYVLAKLDPQAQEASPPPVTAR